MENKQCPQCNQIKLTTEFSKCKTRKDGLEYRCKQCDKERYIQRKQYHQDHYQQNQETILSYSKAYRDKNREIIRERVKKVDAKKRLSVTIVYILPIPHYVGVTNYPENRMSRHKKEGRDTTGWYEVARYNTRKEALAHEAQLHAQGYDGKDSRWGKRYNKTLVNQ